MLEEAVSLGGGPHDYNLTVTNALAALAAAHGDLDQPDDRDRVLEQLNAADLAPTDLAVSWHSLGRAAEAGRQLGVALDAYEQARDVLAGAGDLDDPGFIGVVWHDIGDVLKKKPATFLRRSTCTDRPSTTSVTAIGPAT